jgi:ribosomal protein S27AE
MQTITVNGGKTTLVKKLCASCGLSFVQRQHDHRSECVDCDPPDDDNGNTLGRDSLARPASEKAYHGAGYRD